MKSSASFLAVIWCFVGGTLAFAQTYEKPATLSAAEILKPQVFRGPYHQVRTAVPTGRGVNHFTMDSKFGVFTADGNSLLMMRVQEIYALAKLREVSTTKEFGEAFKRAGQSQLKNVSDTLKDPVGTVAGVPKGALKFIKGVGKKVGDSTQGRQRSQYEDGTFKELAGVSKIKRQLAVRLGVNPYSSNPILQKSLDEVATAIAAGGGAVSLAMVATPAAVSTALNVSKMGHGTREEILESTPDDLYRANLDRLSAMGVEKTVAKAFLANPALSPWHQTLIVQALATMPGVAGREGFVQMMTSTTTSESDALFDLTTTLLIAQMHQTRHPLSRLASLDGYPVCVAQDGTIILALRWDYAQWTPQAARLSDHLLAMSRNTSQQPKVLVALTGTASPKTREELAAREILLSERLAPGPLL